MLITVLTPTFNRKSEISKLYQSLCKQTETDFEWLIVDDGSTDETADLIKEFQRQDRFPIRYIYKENGGKHTALNIGIKAIENELIFIVDSDDILTENAIEIISKTHNQYKENQELCGYAFLRMFPDGKVNGKKFIPDKKIASYIETRINSNDMHSDKAEVFFSKCLKEFPFPEYPGEKFLGKDIVWIRMARKYKMMHINTAIYIGSYLEGGLTDRRREHNINAPLGCMNRANEFMKPDIRLSVRVRAGLQYVIYGKFAGYRFRELQKNTSYRNLTWICFIPGVILYIIWRRKSAIKNTCVGVIIL